MMMPRFHRILASVLAPISLLSTTGMAAQRCAELMPSKTYTSKNGEVLKTFKFPDASIIMNTRLDVNPDGATASYTVGDHGYTYLANGVNLIDKGEKIPCAPQKNNIRCRNTWIKAEAAGFLEGSAEFCVFAMEVEPIKEGAALTACELPEKGRVVVGNGKGRPKIGKSVPTAIGGLQPTYISTTALQHIVDGKQTSIDAALIPGIVAPQGESSLLGAVAWIKYGDRQTFALITDTGPKFGEGSIALHQVLRYGEVQDYQPVGPIPKEQRCAASERMLKAPFQSRPDKSTDTCKSSQNPATDTDIRAYAGIDKGVISIILPSVMPSIKGTVIQTDLGKSSLAEIAAKAGYTEDILLKIAKCLLE